MLYEVIEDYLCDLLVRRFKKYPLGEAIEKEELLNSLPDFEKQPDGTYAINRMNTVFDKDDLDDIIVEALNKLEDEGYFVEGFYSDEYRLFKRLMPGDSVDWMSLREMKYRELLELRMISGKGFALDGNTLSEVKGCSGEETGKSVSLSDEQLVKLRHILEDADVVSWKENYQPEGYMVLDGTSWDFKMVFEGNKVFASSGSNAWPDGFEEFYASIMSMLEEGAES